MSQTETSAQKGPATHNVVLYSLLIGTLATFIAGYYYGRVNHIEQLPQIFRVMDSSYLRNDFAVNATTGYGPRFFYTRLLGFLGKLFPLPGVFLVLTCLQNSAVALITFIAARRLFLSQLWPAVAATILVVSVRSVRLGEADYLLLPALIPASLVTALSLFSVWLGLLDKPFAAMLAALPAVLLHPLMGILCGGIGIGTALICRVHPPCRNQSSGWAGAMRPLAALGCFVAISAGLWLILPQTKQILSTREFLDVYARFRAPHHILPSTFPLRDWMAMLAMLGAASLAGIRTYTVMTADRSILLRMVFATTIVILLWLGGYVFVEILPSRLWITAQTFRLTLLVKWFSLILCAGVAAETVKNLGTPLATAGAAISLAGSGFSQPFVLLWGEVSPWLRRLLHEGIAVPLAFLVATILNASIGTNFKELHALAMTTIVSLLFFGLRSVRLRYLASFGIGLVWIALIITARFYRLPLLSPLFAPSAPTFAIEQLGSAEAGLTKFCRSLLPEDAVFLTPPDFGIFRLAARRAIVVDFKFGMPSDETFYLWRERLRDCYGDVNSQGWNAVAEMDSNWHRVTDGRLLALAKKYKASYAVLYRDTRTDLPVLYSNQKYQLVHIVQVVSLLAFRTGTSPVNDPQGYFNRLMAEAGITAPLGSGYYMLVNRELTQTEALAEYHSAVADGRLPALGRIIQTISTSDQDRSRTTALFFVPEEDSVLSPVTKPSER
ncbi:MAG: DUF6798 domain-containing protein [candidate division WOR-3 bacterium]